MCKRKKGLTIIEIIVTMAVMSLVSIIIFTLFFANNKMITKSQMKSELQSEGDNFSDRIIKYGSQTIAISGISCNGLGGTYYANNNQSSVPINKGYFKIDTMTLALPRKNLYGTQVDEITDANQIVECELRLDEDPDPYANPDEKILSLRDRNSNVIELCKNVEYIEGKFLGYNPTGQIRDAEGIEIKIKFKSTDKGTKQTIYYEISNKIYFRNNQYKNYV